MKAKITRVILLVTLLFVFISAFSFGTFADASRAPLQAKLEYCSSLNSAWYQPKTWDTLVVAMNAAQPYTDAAYGTDAEATDMLSALNNAISGLKKLANLDAIKASIRNLGYLNEKEFTKESWTLFLPVIANAKSAALNLNSSQTTIDKMQNDLVIAQSKLVKIDGTTCKPFADTNADVDKTVLNASVYNVGYLNSSLFTELSWGIFQITYEPAKELLANPNATQAAVNKIQFDLVIAENNLEKDPYAVATHSSELADFPASLRVQSAVEINTTSEEITDISTDETSSLDVSLNSSSGTSSSTKNNTNTSSKTTSPATDKTTNNMILVISIVGVVIVAIGVITIIFGRKFFKK